MNIGKYNKQQSEMILLIALIGVAMLVISYIFFIKPCKVAGATWKAESGKLQTEIDTELPDARKLRELKSEQAALNEEIARYEQGMFQGLSSSRLIPFFTDVAADFSFPTEPGYGYEKSDDLPFGGYSEVYSDINIRSYDYLELLKFLSTLESANPGLRIYKITLNNTDPEGKTGLVNCSFQLRLLGFKHETDVGQQWKPIMTAKLDPGGYRNPFGPATARKKANPRAQFLDSLKNLTITSKWKGYGLVYDKETRK